MSEINSESDHSLNGTRRAATHRVSGKRGQLLTIERTSEVPDLGPLVWRYFAAIITIIVVGVALLFWVGLARFGLQLAFISEGNVIGPTLITVALICIGCVSLTLCGSSLAAVLNLGFGFLALIGCLVLSNFTPGFSSIDNPMAAEGEAALIVFIGIAVGSCHGIISARHFFVDRLLCVR